MATSDVRCSACGTPNRVPRYSVARIPRCGKAECRAVLPEPSLFKPLRFMYRHRRWVPFLFPVGLLGIVLIFAVPGSSGLSQSQKVSCTQQMWPAHGVYSVDNFSPRVAPLKVNTSGGSNYLVKLEEAHTGDPVISFFLYGGASFETTVPLGEYIFKYASGLAWCGDRDLFGNGTVTKKSRGTLVFAGDDDGVEGHEIFMTPQPRGNFSTIFIPRAEF